MSEDNDSLGMTLGFFRKTVAIFVAERQTKRLYRDGIRWQNLDSIGLLVRR